MAFVGLGIITAGCVTQADYPPPPAAHVYAYHQMSPDEEGIVRESLSNLMKDPGSVQFRNVGAVRDETGAITVCGEINAKNSFGGYVGFTPFYGRLAGGEFVPTTIADSVNFANAVGSACANLGLTLG